MKKIITSALALLTSFACAQQIPQSDFYFMNPLGINPAIAGTEECIPVYLSHRMQWVNFNNAPGMQTLSAHSAMNKNTGIGINLMNYTAGPAALFTAQFSYAYRVKLNDKINLSLGIAPSLLQHSLAKNKLTLDEQNDNTFQRISGSSTIADVNAGFTLYGEKYKIGIAVPQLLGSKYRTGDPLFSERIKRHYMLHGSYTMKLKENLNLTPFLIVKAIENGAPIQFDLNAKISYKEFIWGGLAYRFSTSKAINETAIAFIGISKAQFNFAYAFDYSFSSMMPYTAGSHEIMLAYRFCKKKKAEPLPLQ
jgi:type IX secretion system PorP/SprF family membrane protein